MVALDRRVEARGDKGGGVAEEVDVFVDLLDDFQRQFGDQGAVGDEKDGNFLVAVADAANNLERGAFFKLRVAFEVPVQQDGRVAGIGRYQREAVFRRGGTDDFVALIANRLDQALHGTIRNRVRAPDLTCNQQHPTLLVHLLPFLRRLKLIF